MTHKLAIAMQKGGVGKSTTAINLAGALNHAGHDVLVVDADPQGFTTITCGLRDYYISDELNQYNILTDVDRFADVDELVRNHHEYDLLPAHGRNFRLERELWSLSRTQERLCLALDELTHDYDHIIIDTPPNLGPLADGALLAAENVLFASKADQIASFSMTLLLREIETLEKEFKINIETVGAAINDISDNNISGNRLGWFHKHIGEDNLYEVPHTVAIEAALGQGGSIFSYDPENRHRAQKADDVRKIYSRMAAHVEGHHE